MYFQINEDVHNLIVTRKLNIQIIITTFDQNLDDVRRTKKIIQDTFVLVIKLIR